MEFKVNKIRLRNTEVIETKEVVIIGRLYDNFMYINQIIRKKGISNIKHLYWANTSIGDGFHFEPKNLWNRMKMLYYFKMYWLQNSKNIMWIVGTLIAILAVIIAYKSI